MPSLPPLSRLRRRGFTLLEFILVITIIGVLTGYVLNRVTGAREKAYVDAMKADLRRLAVLQESYLANGSSYAADPMTIPGFALSAEVAIDASAGGANEWSATLSHARSDVTCGLAVGTATGNAGRITCSTAPAAPPANAAPTAAYTFAPASPETGQVITFDATTSSDADGTIASYTWDFAGTPGSGATATHTFASAGSHLVTLTVTDNDGATDTYAATVTVTTTVVVDYSPGSATVNIARPQPASYRTATGTLAWAAGGVARDNHWVDGQRYLYLEGELRNSAYFSEAAEQHPLTGLTVSADTRTAPDGLTTADKLVEDGSVGEHGMQLNGLYSAAVTHVSVFVRAAERSVIYVRTVNGSGVPTTSYFNVATGTLVSAGLAHTRYAVEPWADGWYRLYIMTNAGATNGVWLGLTEGGGATSYTGDGASGVHVWGWQVTINAAGPGSYIKTPGNADVYRAPDRAWLPIGIAPQEMALYLRYRAVDLTAGSTLEGAVIGQGSPGARLEMNPFFYSTGPTAAATRQSQTQGRTVTNGVILTSNTAQTGAMTAMETDGMTQLFSDGSAQGSVSIDNAAPLLGPRSATGTIAAAWANGARIYLGAASLHRPILIKRVKVATGVHSIPALR